jgi:hypothetical protein
MWMWQEMVQTTHFHGRMRPMEGMRASCLCLPLCLDGPHSVCMQLLSARRHATATPVRALLLCLPARPRMLLQYACACALMWGRCTRFASRTHARTATPTSHAWSCKTCNIKDLLKHTSKTNEIFTNIRLQRMEYLLKHTSEINETFTNIRLQHMCIAIQIKHLQHMSETAETYEICNCNIRV